MSKETIFTLNRFLSIVVFFLTVGIILCVIQIGLLYLYLNKTEYNIVPYQQENEYAKQHILFLGDSTAVGTGADCHHHSVAGYFAKEYPLADIDNFSANGHTLNSFLNAWVPIKGKRYQLAVLQLGGNDILRFSDLTQVRHDLPVLLEKVKAVADHVVVLHSGNVGVAKVFIWPFSWWMTKRTLTLRGIYQEATAKAGVIYIDLFEQFKNDPISRNDPLYYSPDWLHPSGYGYYRWYEQIKLGLANAGVSL